MTKTITKDKAKLTVEKRTVLGRKVKKLRQTGLLVGNLYGKKIKSQAIQTDLKTFLPIFKQVGETGLVQLALKSETGFRPVLIHNLQLDPVTDLPLHVDFHQVDLKEAITAQIPIELVGEAPAVTQKIGILIQPLAEVEVEALPTDLPDKFEISVSGLAEVDAAITVADLKIPAGVKILIDKGQILVKIEPPAKEEVVTPPPVTEEVPVPTEGEVKEEVSPEPKKEESLDQEPKP